MLYFAISQEIIGDAYYVKKSVSSWQRKNSQKVVVFISMILKCLNQ